MLTVANDYCLFIESAEKYTYREILDYLLRISPLLYLKGSLLPQIIPADEVFSERYVTEEQWENIYLVLKVKFDKEDAFKGHFFKDEMDSNDEILSLAENFADIYQDLKDFLMLYQKRTYSAKENAVYQCAQLFVSHWGPRLLESLPKIHQLSYHRPSNNDNNYIEENDSSIN